MRKIIEIKQKIPSLYLTWVINNICTNQCSYCHPNLHTGTNHNYEWRHAEEFIKKVLNRYSKINLSISGGEPTLSPWLRDLVKMFSDAGHPVGMTTNGARTVRYYEDISQFMSYIVMSYHPSFEDPELLEKAIACSKNTITTVSIMMDSRHFDKSLAMYYKIINEYPTLSVEPVRIHDWNVGNNLGRDYTPWQEEILNKLTRVHSTKPTFPKNLGITGAIAFYDDGTKEDLQAQALINNKQTNFQGWECNIGLESLYVKHDGTIRLGNCISSSVVGKLQHLEFFEWPTTSFICPQTFCNCTTDVYVSKRKI